MVDPGSEGVLLETDENLVHETSDGVKQADKEVRVFSSEDQHPDHGADEEQDDEAEGEPDRR